MFVITNKFKNKQFLVKHEYKYYNKIINYIFYKKYYFNINKKNMDINILIKVQLIFLLKWMIIIIIIIIFFIVNNILFKMNNE